MALSPPCMPLAPKPAAAVRFFMDPSEYRIYRLPPRGGYVGSSHMPANDGGDAIKSVGMGCLCDEEDGIQGLGERLRLVDTDDQEQ